MTMQSSLIIAAAIIGASIIISHYSPGFDREESPYQVGVDGGGIWRLNKVTGELILCGAPEGKRVCATILN